MARYVLPTYQRTVLVVTTRRDPALALLLTPEEAARQLSIGRTKVFALMESGTLRSVKIGRSRRIPADALIEYIATLVA